ncbi:hypothetical protein AB4525_07945 [Vibrio breoganii]
MKKLILAASIALAATTATANPLATMDDDVVVTMAAQSVICQHIMVEDAETNASEHFAGLGKIAMGELVVRGYEAANIGKATLARTDQLKEAYGIEFDSHFDKQCYRMAGSADAF